MAVISGDVAIFTSSARIAGASAVPFFDLLHGILKGRQGIQQSRPQKDQRADSHPVRFNFHGGYYLCPHLRQRYSNAAKPS
jgi:hypothetical protein